MVAPLKISFRLRCSLAYFYDFNCFFQSSKNRRRHSRKTEPESEESDSDQDPLTSSRTESSNQLDAKIKHSKCYRRNFRDVTPKDIERRNTNSNFFFSKLMGAKLPFDIAIFEMVYSGK